MAAHAHLKNGFSEDEQRHNLMSLLIFNFYADIADIRMMKSSSETTWNILHGLHTDILCSIEY